MSRRLPNPDRPRDVQPEPEIFTIVRSFLPRIGDIALTAAQNSYAGPYIPDNFGITTEPIVLEHIGPDVYQFPSSTEPVPLAAPKTELLGGVAGAMAAIGVDGLRKTAGLSPMAQKELLKEHASRFNEHLVRIEAYLMGRRHNQVGGFTKERVLGELQSRATATANGGWLRQWLIMPSHRRKIEVIPYISEE